MVEIKLTKVKPKKIIPTLVYVECPACKKPRLLKEKFADGKIAEVSNETVTAVDETERFVDICVHCQNKFAIRDKFYVKRKAQEMFKAMKDAQEGVENTDNDFEL